MKRVAEALRRPGVFVALAFIAFYRKIVSPALRLLSGGNGFCRFSPTCSEYARQALLKHGFFTGTLLAAWRVLRCNPFSRGGNDPVPAPGEPLFRRMRVGIFGGSFDPPHRAHLSLAEAAFSELKLDRLIFVPAAQSPLKTRAPGASGVLRLAMLRAALAPFPRAEISSWELEQGGTSWSVRTVEHFEDAFPRADFFWIFGADQLALLDKWRDAERLCRKVKFAVMCRDAAALPPVPAALRGVARVVPLAIPPMDLSSTEIRAKVAAGKIDELRGCVPAEVLTIIRENHLYRYGSNEENSGKDQARRDRASDAGEKDRPRQAREGESVRGGEA